MRVLRVFLIVMLIVASAIAAYRWHAHRHTKPKVLAGYVLSPPRPVAPVMLMDSTSHPVLLSSLGNRGAALVYFGYSQCPDACPVTLTNWQRIKRLLGPDAKRVRFVFITVDPVHDTPPVLQAYLKTFDPDFIGLTGSQVALNAAQNALLVQPLEDDPMSLDSHAKGWAHQVSLSVVDSLGRLRAAIPVHASAHTVASDLEGLLNP